MTPKNRLHLPPQKKAWIVSPERCGAALRNLTEQHCCAETRPLNRRGLSPEGGSWLRRFSAMISSHRNHTEVRMPVMLTHSWDTPCPSFKELTLRVVGVYRLNNDRQRSMLQGICALNTLGNLSTPSASIDIPFVNAANQSIYILRGWLFYQDCATSRFTQPCG